MPTQASYFIVPFWIQEFSTRTRSPTLIAVAPGPIRRVRLELGGPRVPSRYETLELLVQTDWEGPDVDQGRGGLNRLRCLEGCPDTSFSNDSAHQGGEEDLGIIISGGKTGVWGWRLPDRIPGIRWCRPDCSGWEAQASICGWAPQKAPGLGKITNVRHA